MVSSSIRMSSIILSALCVLSTVGARPALAQWTRITDPANPISTLSAVTSGSYAGASWVDVDGNGWPDLYPSGRPVFLNQGGGVFTADSTGFVRPASNLGNTWADVDNDGLIDLFQCGSAGFLFHNLGGGSFERVTFGAVGDTVANRGFQAAFGDYDDDGLVDLLSAHFIGGFAGASNSNQLLHNEGGLLFSRNDTTPATVDSSTYIVPSWIDFDDDLDLDLTIGRGPITATGTDDIFLNRLTEDGSFSLEKVTTGALATDLRDGQTHAWIDYDNDGDLDCYVTCYRGGGTALANSLYRNDAGVYVAMDGSTAGEIVTNAQRSTGCVWEDFDNDGWLDCVVSNDGSVRNKYYLNDQDGSFTRALDAMTMTFGGHYAVTAADYDRDGDQDLFVSGAAPVAALYRNDLANGNQWLSVELEGTLSNRSAIGATVRVLATIDGQTMWQRRDVQSTTGSPGMSELPAAFGLGDATNVDSLVVTWPSDQIQVLTNVTPGQFLKLVEPLPASVAAGERSGAPGLSAAFPNPFRETTRLSFEVVRRTTITVDIVDVAGRRVRRLAVGAFDAGSHSVAWDGRSDRGAPVGPGVYFAKLRGNDREDSRKIVRVR